MNSELDKERKSTSGMTHTTPRGSSQSSNKSYDRLLCLAFLFDTSHYTKMSIQRPERIRWQYSAYRSNLHTVEIVNTILQMSQILVVFQINPI